ncbi:hypothetical protein HN51_068975 [Arachis hypogaea]|uniref:AP2/ERF domain-containing protein n=1 Tax=Arachis hypogaea TaxID=3818 RepID=A0A444Z857_ARAHY|nr:ethylene-responsive transcription factor ERF014-like [Arachis ipaensis]XP_025653903.1 ethylene-responsive transcription factor ERF014-like [Arachis hypogaea]QHO11145.1 Ethylene-responsive transcription factor [Arachis hypogaea]RYR10356.1 hypothetical protein Ahy_B05g078822 [Arachis hypogaea]
MSRSSWLHVNNSASSSSTTNNNKKLKGVRRRKWGKWVSEIRVPGTQERLWLGTYATPEAAAVAHDVAVYCLKKPSSLEKLNFPDTLSSYHHCLQQREDLSPRSVQKVASDVAMDVDARNINGRSTTLTTTTSTVAVTETSSGSYCSDVLPETGAGMNSYDVGFGGDSWWQGLGDGNGETTFQESSSEDHHHGGGQGDQPLSISVEDYL